MTTTPRLPPVPRGPLVDVRGSFVELAERFRPEEARGLSARWVIRLADHGSYTLDVRDGRCLVVVGEDPRPDVVVVTNLETWLALVSGRADGLAAWSRGRLHASGDLNLALRLNTLFAPGHAASRPLRTVHADASGLELEALVAGRGRPVLLLHGLGASKVSFLPTVDGLSDRYEVHALDLPGFGKSAKPLPGAGRYSPRWMARVVGAYLASQQLERTYLVGNSLGGRIAVELAMAEPRRVLGMVGLGAAVAFDEFRRLAPFLRLLQGEWVGLAPLPLSPRVVAAAIADLFHDATRVSPSDLHAAAEEFLRAIREPRHRMALLATARYLGAERAWGRRSFWRRLCDLTVPSYWIWGDDDRLSSCRYAERVRACLPSARVEVWPGIGHVPQFEDPVLTNERIGGFFDELEAERGTLSD